jgi:hypothetical protein
MQAHMPLPKKVRVIAESGEGKNWPGMHISELDSQGFVEKIK